LTQGKVTDGHLAEFPSEKFWKESYLSLNFNYSHLRGRVYRFQAAGSKIVRAATSTTTSTSMQAPRSGFLTWDGQESHSHRCRPERNAAESKDLLLETLATRVGKLDAALQKP
jgi:hypothetical protein